MDSGFERLHPLLLHHIVNSLGWRSLRPLQEAAIGPVLDGEQVVLLAPTAGGKTEAALFPILSLILSQPQKGLRLIYLCPIKALLNNLGERLSYYAGLLGLRSGVWHGDTPESARRKMRQDPPELLLTTPESLEVLLISKRLVNSRFFSSLGFVIVDEIHAFAGDDRGRHLLALLARVGDYVPREIQRLGLSATVGNPEQLLTWLCGGGSRPGRVIRPEGPPRCLPELRLDYVGSLANAAKVIAALHRGEKRLVFCDSRARVEELAQALRAWGISTFVSHGSLGVEQRSLAESAFAAGENCVIVATSTLELGIDVGDLDRVIQIDAPATVASFLQRLGRTGRRSGTRANCLFLATSEEALLRAAGLLRLWASGYVEPVLPPALPYHLLAQQLMARCLERGALAPTQISQWMGSVFPDLPEAGRAAVLAYLLETEVLLQGEDGLIWMGDTGEARYGRKHFLELVSIFVSPPLFKVVYGRREIGQVHEHSFSPDHPHETVLTLGGYSWQVLNLDWKSRLAAVTPSQVPGKSRWIGSGIPQSFALSQAVAALLQDREDAQELLTPRAIERLDQARAELLGHDPGSCRLFGSAQEGWSWWTYAGSRYNQAAAHALSERGYEVQADAYAVHFNGAQLEAEALFADISAVVGTQLRLPLNQAMIKQLKFAESVPRPQLEQCFDARLDISEASAYVRKTWLG